MVCANYTPKLDLIRGRRDPRVALNPFSNTLRWDEGMDGCPHYPVHYNQRVAVGALREGTTTTRHDPPSDDEEMLKLLHYGQTR